MNAGSTAPTVANTVLQLIDAQSLGTTLTAIFGPTLSGTGGLVT